MNIDDYRTMVAQAQSDSDKEQTDEEVKDQEVVEKEIEQETTPTKEENTKTDDGKVEIAGLGSFTPEELVEFHNGYMRNKDYTQKTQKVSAREKELGEAVKLYDYLRSNPEVAKKMLETEGVDKSQLQTALRGNNELTRLQEQVQDLLLEKEINQLERKYPDFDAREVLRVAHEQGIANLEAAYKVVKADKPTTSQTTKEEESVDIDALRKQLRDEILNEIKSERDATSTIISSTDQPPSNQKEAPALHPEEDRVRQMFGMTVEEWRKSRQSRR